MAGFIGSSAENQKLIKLISAAIEANRIPYLIGQPGIGKTALVEALADAYGAQWRALVGSTIDPVDLVGYPHIVDNGEGQSIAENTMPDWLDFLIRSARNDGIAFLFLDEFTTSPPAVQAGFLTIMQSRRVGKYVLPENVVIIVAANPPSQAADGWVLAPPMANRLFHIEVKPNFKDWCEGMLVNWNKPMDQREQIIREYIVAFHRSQRHYDWVQALPEDPDEAGGAWPSMRSWDNAASIISKSDDSILYDVMKGCVGLKAADAYQVWTKARELPSYDDIMSDPDKYDWKLFKADETQLILSRCFRLMDKSNVGQTLHVFKIADKGGKTTICASLALPMAKKIREIKDDSGVNFIDEALELFSKYNQSMQAALKKA